MSNIKEEWQDLKGYEEYYEISSLHNIRRKQNTSYRKVSNLGVRVHSGGYEYVQITIKNKSKNLTYHRLIAEHFIPNPDNKPFVNHIDGNKTNNKIENLEWVTASENMIHCFKTGLQEGMKGSKHPSSKLTEQDVIKIRTMYKEGKTTREINKAFPQVTKEHLISLKNYRSWKHLKV